MPCLSLLHRPQIVVVLFLRRSFEEMEAQISAGMKTPVLSTRPGPEGSAGDKGRKRESEVLSRTQSIEREEQEELVLAALRLEALQVAQSISQCPSLSTVTPQVLR
ncbi:hypothetical protein CHARACLAT_009559 [Characodon lateralis]|uniref:Uncharacterized protein n=1 Tax=Characodon lateralis TaxID=208331 RepID=A0ABU7E8G3_9TELE|nr:hypothetical protein [Characodon lateralis]